MKKKFSFFKDNNYHYLKILGVILASILFFVIISNLGVVTAALSKLFNVFMPIFLGLVFAFIFNLPMKFFENKLFKKLTIKDGKVWKKIKRPICLSMSVLFVLSVLIVLLSVVIPEFVRTCEKFFIKLPNAMNDFSNTLDGWLEALNLSALVGDIDIDWASLSAWALDQIKNHQDILATGALEIVTGLLSSIINIILALFFSIYILASKESLGRLVKSFIYSIMKKERAKRLISVVVLSNKAFTGFLSGQCVEVVLIGILCFVGMLIFSMPYAIMVSCIIAVTAFIPIFGPFIGTALGAFLILIENPIKALWFILFMVILQQLESNIIYPRIMGKQVGLPGLWVLVSVTVGGGLFGVPGVILSVPIFSVLYTLFDKWIKKRLKERNICHRTMSHDSSEPKPIVEDIKNYEFDEEYAEDFEDDVYTDEGDLKPHYKDNYYHDSTKSTVREFLRNQIRKHSRKNEAEENESTASSAVEEDNNTPTDISPEASASDCTEEQEK